MSYMMHFRGSLSKLTNRFLFMLGLARKAGAIIIGTELVTKALASGKVKLVIYTQNSSQNTTKRVTDKCKFYGVECEMTEHTSDEVSSAIGKSGSVCVLGITNESFSNQLKTLIHNN